MMIPMDVVRWAADECERQQSGERSVYNMIYAWTYACSVFLEPVTPEHILQLGFCVEPDKNLMGWRTTPVSFANGTVLLNHGSIAGQIASLCTHGADLTADEWYQEFESIHPFVDGNGRVGSILWNWHRNILSTPRVPPRFKD